MKTPVTDTTSRIEVVLTSLRSNAIAIPKQDEVRDYLISYPDMVDLLPFVARVAGKHVGEDTQLSLEVCQDPETGDRHLSLYVRPERYDDHLLETIRDIDAAYTDKLVGKSGWLIVTTDFDVPK